MIRKLFGMGALAGAAYLLRNKDMRDRLFGAAKGLLENAKAKANSAAPDKTSTSHPEYEEAIWTADEVRDSPQASPPFTPAPSPSRRY